MQIIRTVMPFHDEVLAEEERQAAIFELATAQAKEAILLRLRAEAGDADAIAEFERRQAAARARQEERQARRDEVEHVAFLCRELVESAESYEITGDRGCFDEALAELRSELGEVQS